MTLQWHTRQNGVLRTNVRSASDGDGVHVVLLWGHYFETVLQSMQSHVQTYKTYNILYEVTAM